MQQKYYLFFISESMVIELGHLHYAKISKPSVYLLRMDFSLNKSLSFFIQHISEFITYLKRHGVMIKKTFKGKCGIIR